MCGTFGRGWGRDGGGVQALTVTLPVLLLGDCEAVAAPPGPPIRRRSALRESVKRLRGSLAFTDATHWPWFLNCGKAFQPLFLHWSLLVGAIRTGSVSDEAKVSEVKRAGKMGASTFADEMPSSWKFPTGVWMVAV